MNNNGPPTKNRNRLTNDRFQGSEISSKFVIFRKNDFFGRRGSSSSSSRELLSGSDRVRLGRGNTTAKFHGHLKHGWKNIPKFTQGGAWRGVPRPPHMNHHNRQKIPGVKKIYILQENEKIK